MFVAASSRLKVDRAKKHVSELNRSVLTFRRKDPYAIVIDTDERSGHQVLRVKERISPPGDWPLLVGDAIHNLRSALDLLACDAVRYRKRGVSDVHFPFSSVGAEDFERAITARRVHKAGPEIVGLIRDLKPYKGGNNYLYSIHDLDIRDKHKMLIPVVSLTGINDLVAYRPDGSVQIDATGSTFLMPCDDRHIVGIFDSRLKLKYDRKAPFEVRLGVGATASDAVVPALFQMTDLVSQIVEAFERCLNQARPPILLGYYP